MLNNIKRICTYESWQIIKHIDKYYVINKKEILPVELTVKYPTHNKMGKISGCDYYGETDDGKYQVGFNVIRPKEITLTLNEGLLKASLFEDYTYPGINVEYIPKNSDNGPRILMEKPKGENPQAFIWDGKDDDFYRKEKFSI